MQRTLLLVEDSEADRLLATAALNGLGRSLRIVNASSLREAREAFVREGLDVVVLDLNLPDSTGIATLDSVRDLSADMPVVVLTGLGGDFRAQAMAAGAIQFVTKGEGLSVSLPAAVVLALDQRRMQERFAKGVHDRLDSMFQVLRQLSSRVENLEAPLRLGKSLAWTLVVSAVSAIGGIIAGWFAGLWGTKQ